MQRLAVILCVLLVATSCKKPAPPVANPNANPNTNPTGGDGKVIKERDTTDGKTLPVSTGDAEIVRSTAEDLPPVPPKAEGEVEVVSFDDLKIGMPEDAKFRPLFLEYNDGRVKELFDKRISIAGYMDPTDSMRGVGEFVLLRNLDCKFGPGGQADHLVRVFVGEGHETAFTDKVVYVEGTLSLNLYPEDPTAPITYSIYDMTDAKVTKRPPR